MSAHPRERIGVIGIVGASLGIAHRRLVNGGGSARQQWRLGIEASSASSARSAAASAAASALGARHRRRGAWRRHHRGSAAAHRRRSA